jgi:hypothetical protein
VGSPRTRLGDADQTALRERWHESQRRAWLIREKPIGLGIHADNADVDRLERVKADGESRAYLRRGLPSHLPVDLPRALLMEPGPNPVSTGAVIAPNPPRGTCHGAV